MLRGGAAAASDQGEAVLADEGLLGVGQLGRGQRVVRAVLAEDGEARVGHAGQRDARVTGEVAQVLAHLGGAGCAVQADQIDAEGFQGGQRRADLGAEQHRAGRLDGDGTDHRQVHAGGRQGAAGADDRGLGLQQVLGGLDQEGVGASGDHAFGVLLVGVAELAVRGVAQRRQLRTRAHGAEHPALLTGGGGELVGDLAGDARAGLGEFVDPLGNVVLAQGGEVGTERVRLDAVHADREVLLVHGPHDVRAGDVEDLVAAFEVLEVLEGGVLCLEHGAHGTVGYHHSGGERLAEGFGSVPAVSGKGR